MYEEHLSPMEHFSTQPFASTVFVRFRAVIWLYQSRPADYKNALTLEQRNAQQGGFFESCFIKHSWISSEQVHIMVWLQTYRVIFISLTLRNRLHA